MSSDENEITIDESQATATAQVAPAVIPPVVSEEKAPVTPVAEPVTPKVAAPDDSAKKFDEKNRKFLLGKKASRRIEADNGLVIVEEGGEITEEVLQKAKLTGSFVELSMNVR